MYRFYFDIKLTDGSKFHYPLTDFQLLFYDKEVRVFSKNSISFDAIAVHDLDDLVYCFIEEEVVRDGN